MLRIVFLLLLLVSSTGRAVSHGHGHVQMQGTIIDTACAIATGDVEQGIDFGALTASELINNGRGPSLPFTVHLVNCVLDGTDIRGLNHWKDVRITFVGDADSENHFALQGDGRGAALVIADSQGIEAKPGEPMPSTPITPGSMALHYQLWLTGGKTIRPGHIHTTVRYFMEYD